LIGTARHLQRGGHQHRERADVLRAADAGAGVVARELCPAG